MNLSFDGIYGFYILNLIDFRKTKVQGFQEEFQSLI